jgi:5-methylcytosine-specific restriction protein A
VILSQPSKVLALISEPAPQWVGIVGGRRKNERVTDTALSSAHRLMTQAMDAVRAAAGPAASDDELMSVLGLCEGVVRQLDRVTVDAVAGLERRGVFTERGYKSSAAALADLLRWERFEARRRVVAAEHVVARVGLDGAGLPARMPATAVEFEAGRAGLRHVEAIARVLATPAAERLTPEQWAGAEAALADKAGVYTPAELQAWGSALVEALDQDGAEPDDRPPARVNELHLSRLATGGGKLKGRFDDAAMFDAIASVIDAKARPLTNDDDRTAGQRQAEALADVCGYVLDHGSASLVPECGGQRPHVNVLIRLEDLQDRVRAAWLDFGGAVSPESLRMLACDAAAVPIVLNGAGQPLDVGRATRTVPDGLRRAVAARDRGCAHPGCDRRPSWCEVHHIHEWELGGETKLSNLVMLCRAHHRQIHFTEWIVRIRDGLPEFLPPSWIDPHRTPRRKALPHLAGTPG